MFQNKHHSSKIQEFLDDLDWDCADQFHQRTSLNIVHWYPGSFITAIPGNIIDVFTEQGDVVWDPFCGSGTTAVEALRKGRYFIGTDINQIAILISNAKVSLLKNLNEVREVFKYVEPVLKEIDDDFRLFNKNDEFYRIGLSLCSYDELTSWYNKEILIKLLVLRGCLHQLNIRHDIFPIFECVFLNIAKIACAQNKTWGHIADNVKPTFDQKSEIKTNIISSYISRFKQIIKRAEKIFISDYMSEYIIEAHDARNYEPWKPVDFVITSPPYPAMADYVTSQRLAYYWRGNNINHINETKTCEIGARHLRHSNSRNINYLNNMIISFDNIAKCLKSNGGAALLLPIYKDEDPRQSVMAQLYEHLNKTFERMYTIKRNVDESNRWSPFKTLKHEELSIWRKYA